MATYHEAKLDRTPRARPRRFADYDSGRIDAFQLDDVIHQYKRAARELWKFCAVSGAQVESAVRALEWRRAEGEEPDWWEAGAVARR